MANIAKLFLKRRLWWFLAAGLSTWPTAAAAQGVVSDSDIAAAFDDAPEVAADWQAEMEEIVETKPEPAFRFKLPFGRDPFVPAGLGQSPGEPNAPATALAPAAFQLKGTWRQLGGEWQAILQDIAGEPRVVAVGDKIGDAEVLAITEAEVKLRWVDVALDGKAEFRHLTLSL